MTNTDIQYHGLEFNTMVLRNLNILAKINTPHGYLYYMTCGYSSHRDDLAWRTIWIWRI